MKSFSAAIVFLAVAVLVTGSTAATMVFAVSQTLPPCKDPTGQNLPCMMVLSTLPPPANAIQCQETTGQILPCSYATQILSNGQQVVVITIYAPVNFVFSPGVVKVVVHETEKTVINNINRVSCPPFVFCPQIHTGAFLSGYDLGSQNGKVGVYDLAAACAGKTGVAFEHCNIGYNDAYVTACHKSPFGCGDGPKTCPAGESLSDCSVPEGPPPCNGPHPPNVMVACPGKTLIPTSGGKGSGLICGAGNCTSGTTPVKADCTKNPSDPSCAAATQTLTPSTKVDCTKNPSDPSCQQSHTAAYLQALNSGSPNPYKPGTKDYEHYQAGLVARQQNSGTVSGTVTPGGTSGNNPSSTAKKCPDGSTIPSKDKCPTTSKSSKPLSLSAGLSTTSTPDGPSNPSGGTPPPSGGTSSGETSGSGSSGGGSSGNSGNSGSSGSSGSSSSSGDGSGGSGSNSDSGGSSDSHHSDKQ